MIRDDQPDAREDKAGVRWLVRAYPLQDVQPGAVGESRSRSSSLDSSVEQSGFEL